MAKLLYLLRHAQSPEKQPGQTDKEREIGTTGVKETLLIGSHLFNKKKIIDIIYCSTATRAATTAQLISEALKFDNEKIVLEEELYTASVRTFLEFINQITHPYDQIMCVGHNPTISYLAEYLTKAEIGDMPPAGLAIIKFNIDSWSQIEEGNGELLSFITPDSLIID